MYLSILVLPLLGSIGSGFLGRKLGITGSQFISCVCLGISSLFMTIAFYQVCLCGSPVEINLGSWIDSEFMTISWVFYFDQLTVMLGMAVLYCSTAIHIYSIYYLSSDPAKRSGKTLFRELLSNSGEALKLMIPNYNRKIISGWSNHSCMVTSHKIDENQMGYRGSKSDFIIKSVKEQRVDGSWWINPIHLRYTLMGFERNYQIKIPSKQLNIKKYSTLTYPSYVNPWFWTGLIDGEGSFTIVIDKNKNRNLGWRVQAKFQIGVHKRDLSLLLQLQQYLDGIGSIYIHPTLNKVNYSVDSNKQLVNLINHFDKYPLLTQKAADFMLFKQVVNLMTNKAHLTMEGLYKIINIKASMNLGLSDILKEEFKEFYSVERPIINTECIPDGNWLSGFVTGEGNFDVNISQSKNELGFRAQLRFRISQHIRDIKLMELIKIYLGSGSIYKYPSNNAVSLTIVNITDITSTIIPFFEKNPLLKIIWLYRLM